jgi:hypothetical protein
VLGGIKRPEPAAARRALFARSLNPLARTDGGAPRFPRKKLPIPRIYPVILETVRSSHTLLSKIERHDADLAARSGAQPRASPSIDELEVVVAFSSNLHHVFPRVRGSRADL